MQTLAELPEFIRMADKLLTEAECHDEAMPLYLLTLFAKGDQANLSKSERNDLAGLVKLLVQIWKGKPT